MSRGDATSCKLERGNVGMLMGEMQFTQKLCVKCGTDVAGKPRVKDPQGRYLCHPCVDRLKAEKSPRTQRASEPVSVPAGSLELPAEGGVFGVIDLDALKRVAEPQRPRELRVCPACGKAREKDSVICINCGFDERAGFQRGTGVGASARTGGTTTCIKCGYNLKGLKQPRCPECGTVVVRQTEKERLAEESKKLARSTYLRPVYMLLGGLLAIGISGVIHGATATYFGVLLVQLFVGVPLALLVYVGCCAAWIGFDAPIHRVALSLVGIVAIVNAIYSAASLVPYAPITFGAPAIVYMMLLMTELDLDKQDAIIMSVLTRGLEFGLMVAIAMAFK